MNTPLRAYEEASPRCECGELFGDACDWDGRADELVLVEYMPSHLRASHEAAGSHGSYPRNGSKRIHASRDCADLLEEMFGAVY